MKCFILSFLIIFSVLVTGCSTPQDPIVSESIKAEFKKRGMIVLNVNEFVSKDGTITAKLPVGYLKLHNTNLDKENLMLLNMDTKQSIVLSFVPTASHEAIKYNENDIFIKNKLHEFYTKYPDMKTEFTAKKISGKWFWISMSTHSNGYSTMNETNVFHLSTTSKSLEKDAQYILSNLNIKN